MSVFTDPLRARAALTRTAGRYASDKPATLASTNLINRYYLLVGKYRLDSVYLALSSLGKNLEYLLASHRHRPIRNGQSSSSSIA